MSDIKCQHEWEYFDEHDFPNGYEYEQVNIPHKRCKKCGKEYELFDGYGEYAKRWRKVEYWSPELHRLERELNRTRKALGLALDWLEQVATPEKCDDDLCREFTKRKLAEIKTALEKSELENLEMLVNNVFK